ncbi:uncharacterized protein LOC126366479 [Pectinophora gossypiella]|uniref:uncharacterized protein LOC126366479 n=1 Tax=Pectinophora gossypiella TaxID=13191 RepID=UPI00214E951F|nr:uncharacterized protein LOC126366479 [Pectinophora gossypiella]
MPADPSIVKPPFVREDRKHKCPHTCPETYDPVCMQMNRFKGPFAVYVVFQNHCMGDMYYCYNYEKLRLISDPTEPKVDPPPISNTNLVYKMCASEGYMARYQFLLSLNSLQRLGWLQGDQRASHIMTANERLALGT